MVECFFIHGKKRRNRFVSIDSKHFRFNVQKKVRLQQQLQDTRRSRCKIMPALKSDAGQADVRRLHLDRFSVCDNSHLKADRHTGAFSFFFGHRLPFPAIERLQLTSSITLAV